MSRASYLVPALVLGAGLLAACADLSEDECRAGDWASIGFQDGAKGRLPDWLARHAETCARYGIRPDPVAYDRGRAAGLKRYCTPAKAYDEGTRLRSLSPVCPEADLPRLARANELGKEWGRIEREIDRLERRRADLRRIHIDPEAENAGAVRGEIFLEDLRLQNRISALRFEQRRYRFDRFSG